MKTPHLSAEAKGFMRTHIKKHMEKYGMPRSQAIAVAYSEARRKGFKVPKR